MLLVAVAGRVGALPSVELDGVDAVLYLGGGEPRDVELLAGLGVPVYAIPGRRDDHYLARLMAERLVSIEGRVVYHGGGVYFAGVGGREPLANIASVERQWGGDGLLVLVSAHEPHGVCDVGGLGVGRGLLELAGLAGRLGAPVHVFAGGEACSLHRGGVAYVSPGRLDLGCAGFIEAWRGAARGWAVCGVLEGGGWRAVLRRSPAAGGGGAG